MSKKLADALYAKVSTKHMFTQKHPKFYKHHEQNDFDGRVVLHSMILRKQDEAL